MGKIKKALIKLSKKVTGKDLTNEDSIGDVVNFMADNYEGGGGTTVVANPTLAGTEDPLTGLEVDGTKYAVPQGGGSDSTQFYRIGIDFKMKNSSYEYTEYIVICDTTEDISTLDYRDPNNFTKFVELVRGGNLVILVNDGEPVSMGVVCSRVTFGSVEFQIKMLTSGAPITAILNVDSFNFEVDGIYYKAPYLRETESNVV